MTARSIRLRLLLAGAAAIGLALALAAGGLALLFDRHVERVAVADLDSRFLALAAAIEPDANGKPVLRSTPIDPLYMQPLSGHYWQIRLGDQVQRARSLWDYTLPLPETPPAPGTATVLTLPGPRGEALLVLDRSLRFGTRPEAPLLRLTLATDRAELAAARQAFLAELLPYLALLGAALIAASAVQIGVGLRPLAATRARVADLAAGRRRRMGADLPEEVMPLAAEIDGLLEARAAELARARARAGDLAHGLKTPLQALEGDADRLRQRGEGEIATSIATIVTAMRRHVERELTRARLLTDPRHAETAVMPVLRKVVAVLQRTPQGEDTEWVLSGAEDLRARIDAADLTELLGALLENALRHATERVTVQASSGAEELCLSIRDDGPGAPPDLLHLLTQRGLRLDEAGHGIGLAIVADIAEAAGGRIELANADPGFEARVWLPLVA